MHEAVSSPTLVNRRDSPFVVSCKQKKNSYATKYFGKCEESRTCHAAIGLPDSIQACTPYRFDVTVEFTGIHDAFKTPKSLGQP